MISKTRIDEAANAAGYHSEKCSCSGKIFYLDDAENFKAGANWAIAEIEKTRSVGFSEWWDGYIHADTFTHTAKDTWKAATIACSLAKDKELTKLREDNKKLIEALAFYANPESWVRGKNDGNMAINATDRDYLNPCNYGGKRARQALKEISEDK